MTGAARRARIRRPRDAVDVGEDLAHVGLYGGAVDVGVDGFARFERCVFAGNVAASQNADDKYKAGGAVRFAGNGLITDSTFRSNQGAEGAAVHVANGATVRFERTVFVDNEDPSANGGANHLRVVEASLVQLFDIQLEFDVRPFEEVKQE